MKDLSNVDLLSINCVDANASAAALNYCQSSINFGKTILVTNQDIDAHNVELHLIEKLNWEQYNDEVLHLLDHTDNDYVMVIQDDGHIVNPSLWDDEFLKYDYIGSPWPFEDSWIDRQREDHRQNIRDVFPKNRVGNGGFSLRSRKFLEFSDQFDNCGGFGEDAFLCVRNYEKALDAGIKFAPFELAVKFSYENPLIEYGTHWDQFETRFDPTKHFGWHGSNFANTPQLMSVKYMGDMAWTKG
tara:strand:- start:151 stop:879 length:729 start_codon:yes stop_codon:yes gene_type:complete